MVRNEATSCNHTSDHAPPVTAPIMEPAAHPAHVVDFIVAAVYSLLDCFGSSWFIWLIWFVLFLDPEKPNTPDKPTDQINQMNKTG